MANCSCLGTTSTPSTPPCPPGSTKCIKACNYFVVDEVGPCGQVGNVDISENNSYPTLDPVVTETYEIVEFPTVFTSVTVDAQGIVSFVTADHSLIEYNKYYEIQYRVRVGELAARASVYVSISDPCAGKTCLGECDPCTGICTEPEPEIILNNTVTNEITIK